MLDVIFHQTPKAVTHSHLRCFRLKYGESYTRAVLKGMVRTAPRYKIRAISSTTLTQPITCKLCSQSITPTTRQQEDINK